MARRGALRLPYVHHTDASIIADTALAVDAPASALTIRRTLKGSDQYKGRLSVVLANKAMSDVKTSYLETMPWLLQFYLHSLRIVCNGVPRSAPPHVSI